LLSILCKELQQNLFLTARSASYLIENKIVPYRDGGEGYRGARLLLPPCRIAGLAGLADSLTHCNCPMKTPYRPSLMHSSWAAPFRCLQSGNTPDPALPRAALPTLHPVEVDSELGILVRSFDVNGNLGPGSILPEQAVGRLQEQTLPPAHHL
jgi:hypothetical protein